ncbi:MAG: lipocalin family protein [Saprospiraceae bacterium]
MKLHLHSILKPILIVVLIAQLPGCSKDPIESLVGTWNFDGVKFTSVLLGTIKLEGDGTFTFNADGTGYVDYQIIDNGSVQAVEGDILWTATKSQVTITESNKLVVYQRAVNKSKKQVLTTIEGASTAELTLRR